MNSLHPKRCLIALTGLLTSASLLAQTTIASDSLSLSLDKAIDIALDENPTIQMARGDVALKKVAAKAAWQNLLPEASLNGSLSHTVKAPEMKLNGQSFKMGQDGTNTAAGVLTVNLPLFAPSVYRAMAMSQTDIALAVEKSRASRQDLINQVTKAYYQLMLAQDSHEVLKAGYALAQQRYRDVEAKFNQGLVSEFDKISAEVQMRSAHPGVVSAAHAVEMAELQLKVLMGITADVKLHVDDNLTRYESQLAANEADALIGLSLQNNSALKQLDLNNKLLNQSIRQARSALLPTLGMSFNYQYQSLQNPHLRFHQYDWVGSSSLMFNLSIPLYRAGNFTNIKQARLQLKQLEWSRMDTERKLQMQATNHRNSMIASSEQVTSNRENVKQAEKAVDIADKRYQVGKGTVLELNSSQVSLTQARLAYHQSIYDYLVAKSELDLLLGKNE